MPPSTAPRSRFATSTLTPRTFVFGQIDLRDTFKKIDYLVAPTLASRS